MLVWARLTIERGGEQKNVGSVEEKSSVQTISASIKRYEKVQ
jgi:hypothetical protein